MLNLNYRFYLLVNGLVRTRLTFMEDMSFDCLIQIVIGFLLHLSYCIHMHLKELDA